MSQSARLGERPRACRIDDLGSAHTWTFPRTAHSRQPAYLEPPPAGLASVTRASALLRTGAPMR
jgi:hypothetical protein